MLLGMVKPKLSIKHVGCVRIASDGFAKAYFHNYSETDKGNVLNRAASMFHFFILIFIIYFGTYIHSYY
jgi:hypothetical protein